MSESPRNPRNRREEQQPAEPALGVQLPQDVEAERAVLGSILLQPGILRELGTSLDGNDFHLESHRLIFLAMADLERSGRAVDQLVLISRLRELGQLEIAGGMAYIAGLAGTVPHAEYWTHYVTILRSKRSLRDLIGVTRDLHSSALGPVENAAALLDEAARRTLELSLKGSTSSVVSLGTALSGYVDQMSLHASAGEHGLVGVPSGFYRLDAMTQGWQPGNLIIIAARPGMGKTAFALNLATNAAQAAKPVGSLIFSLEMSSAEIAGRVLSYSTRIPMKNLRGGNVGNDWSKVYGQMEALSALNIFVDDTPALSISEMMRKCRQYKQQHDIGLVIVDYLQLMQGSSTRKDILREQVIAEISRSLKALAKELGIPVIALSQLNRGVEARTNKRPMLSDLRESGAIEQDADIIVFLYRDYYYAQLEASKNNAKPAPGAAKSFKQAGNASVDSAEVIVAKHRAGETGTIELQFYSTYTLFANNESDDPGPTDADMPHYVPRANNQADFPPPGGGYSSGAPPDLGDDDGYAPD